MSKPRAIWKTVVGVSSAVGCVGTMLGSGAVHVAAGMLRMRIPSGTCRVIAQAQAKAAQKAFAEASREWNREE